MFAVFTYMLIATAIIVLMITQIVIPIIRDRPLFPLFTAKKVSELEGTIKDLNLGDDVVELQKEVKKRTKK